MTWQNNKAGKRPPHSKSRGVLAHNAAFLIEMGLEVSAMPSLKLREHLGTICRVQEWKWSQRERMHFPGWAPLNCSSNTVSPLCLLSAKTFLKRPGALRLPFLRTTFPTMPQGPPRSWRTTMPQMPRVFFFLEADKLPFVEKAMAPHSSTLA